jgi:predicted N-acetyltransferase YhbS
MIWRTMPDMLARLYDLPDPSRYFRAAAERGINVRRAEPWDRERLRAFAKENFGELWAVEADRCFNHTPITGFVATLDAAIAGFAVFECTRRGYFGPTGVREDLRGGGLGAALLFRCLEAMREMGYAYAIIGGVGPAAFYEKTCGAFVIPGSETGIYAPLNEIRNKEGT